LAELGQRLKEARTKKNMTLEELQVITKIQKRYLQNIEDGNYEALPGVFYARAFVKQYSEAVGLNADVIFEEFKNEIPTTYNDSIPQQLSRVKRARAEVNTNDNKIFQLIPKVLVTVVLLGIAFTVWSLLQNQESPDQVQDSNEKQSTAEFEQNTKNPLQVNTSDENDSSKQTEETTKNNEVDDSVVNEEDNEDVNSTVVDDKPHSQEITLVETVGRKSVYTLTNASEYIIEVQTTGETWLELKNNKNHKFFSGMLTTINGEKTTSHDYSNESEARIKLGKAIDSVILVNGQMLNIPKEPKDLQEITIVFEKATE
jgi:cytoskeletal protein RodZ